MKSLYIHIPFCTKKCLFCSFAISVGAGHRANEYVSAIEKEIIFYKNEKIFSIYFGGGTPTFLNSLQLSRIIDAIRKNFIVDKNISWGIEANPENIDAVRARELKELGFNRISLGVQTFYDAYLKFLGRAHSAADAMCAYSALREVGFDNINVDLMYGFPKQSRQELRDDLKKVVSLNPEHVSVYTLTIEPNSRFYAQALKLDDDEKLGDDYVFVADYLNAHGICQYEVSNFAKPGFESTHNISYWKGKGYIGIGMGAHGFIDNRRYWNVDKLQPYMEVVNKGLSPVAGEENLTKKTVLSELLIFGLRMNEGVDVKKIEQQASQTLSTEQQKVLQDLMGQGFLENFKGRIRATLKGRLVLDEIAVRLI